MNRTLGGGQAGTNVDISSNQITISATGTYLCTYSVTLKSNYANRSCVGFYLKQVTGGSTNPIGSAAIQYFRQNTYGDFSTLSACFIFQASASSAYELTTSNALDGAWNHSTQSASVYRGIMVQRLT